MIDACAECLAQVDSADMRMHSGWHFEIEQRLSAIENAK